MAPMNAGGIAEALDPCGLHSCAALSPREVDVLRLVSEGMTNREIADRLFVSMDTVRTHVKHIHDKCDVKGRARLAVQAYALFAGGRDASNK